MVPSLSRLHASLESYPQKTTSTYLFRTDFSAELGKRPESQLPTDSPVSKPHERVWDSMFHELRPMIPDRFTFIFRQSLCV